MSKAPVTSVDDGKQVPGDPCWPSEDQFSTLNRTVSGNLIKGVPPGAVCYPARVEYDEAACEYVRANWLSSTFHATDPISVGWAQWAGNPCPPIFPNGTSVDGDPNAGMKGCSLGGYPVYALNATEPLHIQSVIRFATEHSIRVNIKSTGHSFTGRSTAFGSISIWTHYLQGIDFVQDFKPDLCSNALPHNALRIAAGSRVRDVYEAADRNGVIAVGGSAQDVGIVGWLTGGGHGPLTSKYGMGADNVLQATVVTPGGEIVTSNECQYPDLLWAIRGGGGGTFGVVTEVVMKAFPSPTMESLFFSLTPIATNNSLEPFWNATTYLLSEQPRLKDAGMSGYMLITSQSVLPVFSGMTVHSFTGSLAIFDAPNGTADTLFKPIKQHMASYGDNVNFTTDTMSWPSFFSSWNSTIGDETVGGAGIIIGSRLLTRKSLTADNQYLNTVVKGLATHTGYLGVYSVANSANRNASVALNPAWRDAVLHSLTGSGWLDSASKQEQWAAATKVTKDLTPRLKSLAPDGGAYFNEGDPFDPNWQYTFFGENYPRLHQIKKHYDPDSTLWCYSCVGSENWAQEDDGRLCKIL